MVHILDFAHWASASEQIRLNLATKRPVVKILNVNAHSIQQFNAVENFIIILLVEWLVFMGVFHWEYIPRHLLLVKLHCHIDRANHDCVEVFPNEHLSFVCQNVLNQGVGFWADRLVQIERRRKFVDQICPIFWNFCEETLLGDRVLQWWLVVWVVPPILSSLSQCLDHLGDLGVRPPD